MQTKYLCFLIHIWMKVEMGVPWNGFKPSSIFFNDRSKACFLCKSFMLFLSCFCYAFVRICLLMPCGHLLEEATYWLPFVMSKLWSGHFPIGILGQVLCLIVLISDLCHLSYFQYNINTKFTMYFYLRNFLDQTLNDRNNWKLDTPDHSKQIDSFNCGVYTLMVREYGWMPNIYR